jgi:hypothetical protein
MVMDTRWCPTAHPPGSKRAAACAFRGGRQKLGHMAAPPVRVNARDRTRSLHRRVRSHPNFREFFVWSPLKPRGGVHFFARAPARDRTDL